MPLVMFSRENAISTAETRLNSESARELVDFGQGRAYAELTMRECGSRRSPSLGAATLAFTLLLHDARAGRELGAAPENATAGSPRFAVIDLHVDLPYQLGTHGQPLSREVGQAPLAKLRAGGVEGVVLPLFVPARVSPSGVRLRDFEELYARLQPELGRKEGLAAPGCDREQRPRTWLSFEGAGPLAGAPERLELWARRGLRLLGLVHTSQNALASSSGDVPAARYGLTPAGRALVRRAHALGIAIDVSHASDRAIAEVLSLARETHGVVLASHSNARALSLHPRNLSDDQLRGIAATGGVVGLNFHSPFVVRGRPAELADVVRQALYLVRVAGPDHVAIGSDFEGDIRPPRGLEDAGHFPDLSRALLAAGLGADEIRKLFSGNALRVLCPAEEERERGAD